MSRDEMIKATESLAYCLRGGHDADAQQWCLEILNGLYGDAVRRVAAVREAVDTIKEPGP